MMWFWREAREGENKVKSWTGAGVGFFGEEREGALGGAVDVALCDGSLVRWGGEDGDIFGVFGRNNWD